MAKNTIVIPWSYQVSFSGMIIENVEALESKSWDVIVIGTGMGGATIGFSLARAGKRVLFCEQGQLPTETKSLRGNYAEAFFGKVPETRKVIRERSGRWSTYIEDRTRIISDRFIPFLGIGCGGSSALYGGVLERLRTSDFDVCSWYKEAEGTSLVRWPISYHELDPYYTEAESLYHVQGERDPLGTPAEKPLAHEVAQNQSPSNGTLRTFLESRGLHPYVLPRAIKERPEESQGYLDATNVKLSSLEACLLPAVREYDADLLTECTVMKLEADQNRVTGVVCLWKGKEYTLKADIVILAGGALLSPALLLKSASAVWPDGLANSSGLVGKNLMRHYVDLFKFPIPGSERHLQHSYKELAFNDWYETDTGKYGTVQAFGRMMPFVLFIETAIEVLEQYHVPVPRSLFRKITEFVGPLFDTYHKKTHMYASIIEDLPYEDNRVFIDGETICLKYRIRTSDKKRIQEMRRKIKRLFKPLGLTFCPQAENNRRLAHVVGTCRFGDDPEKSVLNRYNKAHDLENLYVVDGSFFPTSGGVNPSLTIAANALRVAAHIR